MNEFKMTFDEFLDWLDDDDSEVLPYLSSWLMTELKMKEQLSNNTNINKKKPKTKIK